MPKTEIQQAAIAKGVSASYSGKEKTMFINGDDSKVKSFIRNCNLKGKAYWNFLIKQGTVTQG